MEYLKILIVLTLVLGGVLTIVLINQFLTFKKKVMGKLEELEQALADQKAAIAEEKQQVSEKLTILEMNIEALEQQVAEGGTSERIQELINTVKDNTADLKKVFVTPEEEAAEEGTNEG